MSRLRRFQLFAAVAVSFVLGACATPARVEQMQIDTPMAARVAIASSALKESIAIKDVSGGGETNPLWMSKVASADFERALEASLRSAGLAALGRQAGRFQLTAHLQKLDQPFAGFSMTVTATVEYTLIERATGRDVFKQTIAASHTASVSDAFVGVERLKLANEGAARGNIQKLIEALSQLRV